MCKFREHPAVHRFSREQDHRSFLPKIKAAGSRNFDSMPTTWHWLDLRAFWPRGFPSRRGKRCISAGYPRFRTRICMVVLLAAGTMPFSFVAIGKSTSQGIAPATTAWASYITEASRRFDVPANWIGAVLQLESKGDNRALSPKGAMGLMQVMPETFSELRLRYHLGADPYEPRSNILAGTAYLREMHDRYGPAGFLAAYNAGPGRYDDYLMRGRTLPKETHDYVAALAVTIGVPALPRDPENPLALAVAAAQNHGAPPAKVSQDGFSPRISPFDNHSGTRTRMLFAAINIAVDQILANARTVDMTALEPSSNSTLSAVSASGDHPPNRGTIATLSNRTCAFRAANSAQSQSIAAMHDQWVLSRHRARCAVPHLSTNGREGGRQDKSRTLARRMEGNEARKLNPLAQGARKPCTLAMKASHGQCCHSRTLLVAAS